MDIDDFSDRRAFLATALATLVGFPVVTPQASQAPEVRSAWAEVPPGATLWALVVFTGTDPVEVTLAARKAIKSIRGRFGAQRFVEYSWRNSGGGAEKVIIRARAMVGDRELPPAKVQFLSEQNIYVGFGHRSTPVKLNDRDGGYPYEALFMGFIVFES
jgi:hypothetical protein